MDEAVTPDPVGTEQAATRPAPESRTESLPAPGLRADGALGARADGALAPEPRTEARPAPDPRGMESTIPSNIYRARRPAVAGLLILPAVLIGLLLIRGLAIAAFGRTFQLGGVIASSLALAALPLLVSGLYGLITGAAYGAEQFGFKVWARPPLAYLIVGIAFVAAAGFAIS
ncbi:MAG TPA: hypothetical protein VF163_07640 [Micromonosporaceae bacterium]